jgi:hypothetical protein
VPFTAVINGGLVHEVHLWWVQKNARRSCYGRLAFLAHQSSTQPSTRAIPQPYSNRTMVLPPNIHW